MTLAVLNNVPIFVAEEVLETAGTNIPETVKGSPNRKGLEKIINGMEERQRQYKANLNQARKQYRERSQEDIARDHEKFIAAMFQ